MSQDVVADILNQIMNAKRAKKKLIVVNRNSKLLREVLGIMKEKGHLDYGAEGNEIKIELKDLNENIAIKPRYTVPAKGINRYVRRFLPAKNFGTLIISTNKGLMTHKDAEEKNMGGCLIAYVF